MSLDKLAIIFFIIVLPISVILNAYTDSQIETLNLQISYDNKLKNATYDAVKAFQLNTINSSTSDLANSKIRDIEASVNTFFNSMSTNFNVGGYNTATLQEYVPALVYTMYDGYYIYSPYTNTLPEDTYTKMEDNGKPVTDDSNATYKNKEKLYGLKPFIHYSCEYKKGNDNFVITYSLDNYITIQGVINNQWVNDAGYLVSDIEDDNGVIKYRENIEIQQNQSLMTENLIDNNGNKQKYSYQKINGVKYYKKNNNEWFSLLNGTEKASEALKDTDSSAYHYYKEAKEFMERISEYKIGNLTTNDCVDPKLQDGKKIFDDSNIEEPNSNFNQHRLAVIRYAIEKNLSIAIANYNNYTNIKTNFQMPKLKEDEWDKILNNISVISFMQGLNIGNKVYNGYSIVTNNNNEEVVTENSIYIANNNDSIYYSIFKKGLNESMMNNRNYIGIFNMDLQRKSKEASLGTCYYYPKLFYADYNSVVYQTDVENLKNYNGNIYQYMKDKPNLAKVYYTALGRERYGMYKANRNMEELIKNYK